MNSARALLDGHITSMQIALVLQQTYGANNVRIALTHDARFQEILFDERWTDEDRQKRLFERTKTHRQLSVFTDSMTIDDHRDIAKGPCTALRTGPWGDSSVFLRILCEEFGGFFNETDLTETDVWERIECRSALPVTPARTGMTSVQASQLRTGDRLVMTEETRGVGADDVEHVYPERTPGVVSRVDMLPAPQGLAVTVIIGPTDGDAAIVNVFDETDALYPFIV